MALHKYFLLTIKWQDGIYEGDKKRALKVARGLKKKGVEVDIIAEVTEIPVDEIMNIQN